MSDNHTIQSGYTVGQLDQMVLAYTQGFKRVADGHGPLKNMLMIGGGAYTFPSLIARQQPDAQIDVVEIDPVMDQMAVRFFDFDQTPNVRLTHQDGRVYLNRNDQQYDMIYMDAFSSLSPPYQLTTIEATGNVRRALAADGQVVVNVFARPQSDDGYYAATYQTYKQVFESVKVYRVNQAARADVRQSLVFVMGNAAATAKVANNMRVYREASAPAGGQVLSDDHAPVDQLIESSKL
jgi:spermidine synthase